MNRRIVKLSRWERRMKTLVIKEFNGYPIPDSACFDLSEAEMKNCAGCWICWWKTPGICIYKDLEDFYRSYVNADRAVIFAKPENGFISSRMKTLLDRMIPLYLPYTMSAKGGTLEFLYALSKAAPGQSLSFIIQAGYPESSESEIVSRFFQAYASHLGYGYLGTVVKGECAGIALMPRMFKKLKKQFAKFGALYEQTGRFDEGF